MKPLRNGSLTPPPVPLPEAERGRKRCCLPLSLQGRGTGGGVRERTLIAAVLLAVLLSGCNKDRPMLAGGKPVSHWIEALKDPDAKLRKTAVAKLGNVGPADEGVLPALLGALGDTDAAVRREAILALMKYGPGAREAIPRLTEMRQHDRDAQVRTSAAKALEKLERDSNSPR